MRYVQGSQHSFCIPSTGMYLKYTQKGKKHDHPAVQRQVKEDLDEYAVLMSDPSSSFFDDYDFDEYADLSKCAYRIKKIKDAAENKRHGMVGWSCNCTNYFKHGKCKHSLAYAIHRGEKKIPAEYDMETVGSERTAGRPKKAKGGGARG